MINEISNETLTDVAEKFELNLAVNTLGTDKIFPKLYAPKVYEKIFQSLKESELMILEVGIRTGASLKLWVEYFSRAYVTGVDISNHDVVEKFISHPRIRCIFENAYSENFLPESSFDIIIDDGPHSLDSQIFAITYFVRLLKPGGFLFIEDIIGGKPYVTKLLSKIIGNSLFEVKVFDLRQITGASDSIIIGVHRKIHPMASYWGRNPARIPIEIRLAIYRLFAWFGINRFKL